MSEVIHDVAVIGAGVSGLSAASTLQEMGLKVVVVEKSRGVGGRAATRRVRTGPDIDIPVDHGAQFFTARDMRFQEKVARWQEQGVCFPWTEEFYFWSDGHLKDPDPRLREVRYACRDGMNQLGKNLAEGVTVIREYPVQRVHYKNESWQMEPSGEKGFPPVCARSLIVSAPIPQALKLVGYHFSAAQHALLDRVIASPCVAVMAVYKEMTPQPPWRGIQIRELSSKLSWIGWDSSRRANDTFGRVAILHGSKEFSKQWLESSPDELRLAGLELLGEAAQIAGGWMGDPASYTVHRWRYAHLEGPCAPGGFLRSASAASLYLVGDGLNGGRIEGAWLSGLFAAEDLLSRR